MSSTLLIQPYQYRRRNIGHPVAGQRYILTHRTLSYGQKR